MIESRKHFQQRLHRQLGHRRMSTGLITVLSGLAERKPQRRSDTAPAMSSHLSARDA